jgi:sugar phosphate isomerase/epimerase
MLLTMTRRTLVSSLVVTTAAMKLKAAHSEWKPRIGILGPYTPANVEFAKSQNYNNMILGSGPGSTLDAEKITDAQVESVKSTLKANGIHVSALQVTQNHISADTARRAKENAYFEKAIELAGRLEVTYIGAMSGKNAALPFPKQIDEISRVYNEKYFPACEKNKVRICWEPWPEGPNLATSPVGYDALFHAFNGSPYVGLQFDPSHFVRQFMDPIEVARNYADKIYDVHLKDTEISPLALHSGGINPVNGQQWWRYRIPGLGIIHWNEFFSILQGHAYTGAMSVEHEDDFYGADDNPGPDFSEPYKIGFVMARRYLNQYVP